MAEATSSSGGADTLAPPLQPSAETKSTLVLNRVDDTSRPFSYEATDDDIADLKRRIASTRCMVEAFHDGLKKVAGLSRWPRANSHFPPIADMPSA